MQYDWGCEIVSPMDPADALLDFHFLEFHFLSFFHCHILLLHHGFLLLKLHLKLGLCLLQFGLLLFHLHRLLSLGLINLSLHLHRFNFGIRWGRWRLLHQGSDIGLFLSF